MLYPPAVAELYFPSSKEIPTHLLKRGRIERSMLEHFLWKSYSNVSRALYYMADNWEVRRSKINDFLQENLSLYFPYIYTFSRRFFAFSLPRERARDFPTHTQGSETIYSLSVSVSRGAKLHSSRLWTPPHHNLEELLCAPCNPRFLQLIPRFFIM